MWLHDPLETLMIRQAFAVLNALLTPQKQCVAQKTALIQFAMEGSLDFQHAIQAPN